MSNPLRIIRGRFISNWLCTLAVATHLIDVPFVHNQLSVFRHFEAFAVINPIVNAPTLVLDDGTVLMDPTQILLWAERLAKPRPAQAL